MQMREIDICLNKPKTFLKALGGKKKKKKN